MFISNFYGFLLDEFGMLSGRAGFSATAELSCCFFNQTQDLRAPSADRHETLPRDQYMRQHFNASPTIPGALPKKIWAAKNMQNLERFYTISDFDHEYVISSDSCRVQPNKSGELW